MLKKYTRLQEAIVYCGLDVATIVSKTGYSQGAISKILNGKTEITPQFTKIFCSEFNISEDWLNYGNGDFRTTKAELVSEFDGLSLPELLEVAEILRKWKSTRK